MTALRSLIFNIIFYLNLTVFLLLGSVFFAAPRKWAIRALQAWARTSLWWLRVICGTRIEVRGLRNIPAGAILVAGKHQSFWETFAILPYLDDPCMVLKKELTWIPFFGWFIFKFRMIAVERSAGSAALRKLMARGVAELARGRQIVIMPEGTRRAPDAAPDTSRVPRRFTRRWAAPACPSRSTPASIGPGANSGAIPAPSFWNFCP